MVLTALDYAVGGREAASVMLGVRVEVHIVFGAGAGEDLF